MVTQPPPWTAYCRVPIFRTSRW